MQVITKVTLDQFQNALGLNRRSDWNKAQDGQRVYQIDTALSPTPAIVSKVVDAYWEWRKTQCLVDKHPDYVARWELERCKIRLAYYSDATIPSRAVGGYIVMNGELLGFHNSLRGYGKWMLDHAVADGAHRLDCLDIPHLVELYRSRGFVEYRRECNHVKGKPDVIWMQRNDS